MTARVRNAPKWPLLGHGVAMANPVASLVTNLVLAVTASLRVMEGVKALPLVAHVWGTRLSVRNAMRWNPRKTPCVAWLRKPMVKC
jgi:hypothetical protein